MINKDDFTVIMWPDIQDYMDKERFAENSELVNGNLLDEYGSSAYFVRNSWLCKNSKTFTQEELMNEINTFRKNHIGILNTGDLQTLVKFVIELFEK
jgi:hypothetical protein